MLNRMFTLVILLIFSLSTSYAEFLPQPEPVPGGIAVVALDEVTTQEPEVYFQNQRVMVVPNEQGKWRAIVGLPFELKPGIHALTQKTRFGDHIPIARFQVKTKDYPKEYLYFKQYGHRKPSSIPEKRSPYIIRLEHEKEHIQSVLSQWSHRAKPFFAFQWPLQGRLASPFGLHRFYNRVPGKQHAGLDIAAPTGTPIHTPTPGRVVDVGNYLLTGKTVILDHGQGMFTIYAHMSQIKARLGQFLSPGDLIGRVGRTGRATGAHLHWGLVLNHARVNPLLCINHVVEEAEEAST